MEAEKIRNLSDTELAQSQRDQMDQLFRLKFQMKMGQTESLNKIRSLRRGVARMKTIARERTLGISGPVAASAKTSKTQHKSEAVPAVKVAAAKTKAKSKAKAKAKPAKKTAAQAKKTKSGKKSGKR